MIVPDFRIQGEGVACAIHVDKQQPSISVVRIINTSFVVLMRIVGEIECYAIPCFCDTGVFQWCTGLFLQGIVSILESLETKVFKMQSSSVPMTKSGEQALKEELSRLIDVERPSISKAISEAREHGDLKENAEYHAAKELQGLIEAKINEMEIALANAQVIDVKEIPETGRVVFGSTVTVIDLENDKEITYKIVGNLESDPDNGHISIDTPIAKGLVGKFIDDEINIQTPSGNLNFEILEVKHI